MAWLGLLFGLVGLVLGVAALVRVFGVKVYMDDDTYLTVEHHTRQSLKMARDKRKAVGGAELDFSAKRARREAEKKEWDREFLAGFGENRGTFVREWKAGSVRVMLLERLQIEKDLAEKDFRIRDATVLERLQADVWANPERVLDLRVRARAEEYLHRLEQERGKRSLLSYEAAPWRF
jgi:hypothetical protein